MNDFERFLEKLKNEPALMDDPEWLSGAAVQLATILYNVGTEMANARFEEDAASVAHMESPSESGKKMSVAESEKRATVDTRNAYERLKLAREAIIETINSIKKRLEVLSWERRN